jgi:hypothetical protein
MSLQRSELMQEIRHRTLTLETKKDGSRRPLIALGVATNYSE